MQMLLLGAMEGYGLRLVQRHYDSYLLNTVLCCTSYGTMGGLSDTTPLNSQQRLICVTSDFKPEGTRPLSDH